MKQGFVRGVALFFCMALVVLWLVPLAIRAKSVGAVRAAGAENLNILAAGTAPEAEERPLLILMYHQFLNSKKSQYIVTPDTLRQDLKCLKARGYGSVTARQVVQFVNGAGELPPRPVLLTFDDGHFNNLFYAESILKEEGFTAVVSPIGRFSANSTDTNTGGNPNYSHLTWSDLRGMAQRKTFEIGNHTYNMHNFRPRFGVGKMAGEGDAEYRQALREDIGGLQQKLLQEVGEAPIVFAYPFGKYNNTARDELLKMGFCMMLTCNEGVSILRKGDSTCLYLLKRYNRNPWYEINQFLEKLQPSAPKSAT